MPKTRPTDGDSNWGVTLNEHLAQLQGSTGGINTSDTDPTLTADDEGYTYVNTVTKKLRKWNGASWNDLILRLNSYFGCSQVLSLGRFKQSGRARAALAVEGERVFVVKG